MNLFMVLLAAVVIILNAIILVASALGIKKADNKADTFGLWFVTVCNALSITVAVMYAL